MTDWNAGYMTDIAYTYGYYPELNPLRVQLAFLSAGLATPQAGTACELGFGQGLSVNAHAAASTTTWYGTDFNPAHAAFARELAGVAGAGAQLYDASFAEFCARDDLPDFDSIGLHGIWSWISDENRALIVDFVRRKLKVGGVLYISYNTLPGWAPMLPMRHLLSEYAQAMGAPGQGIVKRIDGAIAFAERLMETQPGYARAQPGVVERLKALKEQNRHYLAHEYFNREWQPMPFAEMNRWLSGAKLSYACSAHFMDHLDAVNLTPQQQAFLHELADPVLRETVRDFMVNQQFRKDYWVRGARRLNAVEQAEQLRQQRLLLARPLAEVALKTQGPLGEATFAEAAYKPVLEALAGHTPQSLQQIAQAVAGAGLGFAQVLQAAVVLVGKGDVVPVMPGVPSAAVQAQCQRLNRDLMDRARSSADVSYLASPVTGGAVVVGRFQQLFLLARVRGGRGPADWADFVWRTLAEQGLKLVKNGVQLETATENLAELTQQAQDFAARWLPILQGLQVSAAD